MHDNPSHSSEGVYIILEGYYFEGGVGVSPSEMPGLAVFQRYLLICRQSSVCSLPLSCTLLAKRLLRPLL